jgi:putative metalloprotease
MIKLLAIILPIMIGFFQLALSSKKEKKRLTNQSTVLKEPILKALVRRISAALNLEDIKILIHEVNNFNGLATSDGTIFITRGSLNAFYEGKITAEELSSVIAHELGHVALGHSKRRMLDFSTQNALRIILSLAISRLLPAIGTYIANFLTSILASKLSRNDEYEADAYAAALLIKAGIGTDPQINLLQKLENLTSSEDYPPTWLRSHPKSSDRINAIQKLASKWQKNY